MKTICVSSLLFISLFLTSCSIDWNWKNDKEISELKAQVQELKQGNNTQTETSFVCPEDIVDPQGQVDAVAKFIQEYSKKNPDATIADVTSHRFDMFTEHKCVKTLTNMLQRVSPDDSRIYFNWKVFWPQNFQFTPDTAVGTAYYTINGQWLENPDEELMFNFYIKNVWSHKTFSAKNVADNIVDSYKGSSNSSVINSFMAPDKITGLDDYLIVSKAIYSWFAHVYVMKISKLGDSVFSVTYSKKFTDSNSNLSTSIDNWLLQDLKLSSEGVSVRLADVWADVSWVDYIKNIASKTSSTNQEDSSAVESNKIFIVQQDVNLRDAPSAKSQVIRPIIKWETIQVIESLNAWGQTWFNIKTSNNENWWISEVGFRKDDTVKSAADFY